MDVLTLNQSLGIIVAIIALFPVPLLVNFYLKSKDLDFLLFAFVFIFGAIVLIADALVSITNLLIIIQIHHFSIDIMFFLLFLHAIRIRWTKAPKIIFYTGVIWFILLAILTLSWKLMVQPTHAKVLFWDLPHTFSSYFPKGAGLMLADGTVIYSTAFRYLGEFYRIYVVSILLFSYLKIEIIHQTNKIEKAKKLWIFIWICLLIHSIALFFPTFTELVSVFLLVGGIVAVYIVIRVPEALLLTHAQISRAVKLLGTVEFDSPSQSYGFESYIDYLRATNEILEKKRNNL